jgi:hypothetical protein
MNPADPPPPMLPDFCRRRHISELSLFGSALREDFGPASDIDLLVTFDPGAPISLWDWGPMLEELRGLFGRPVDLVERSAIRNPIRRRHVLAETRLLYAA